MAYRYLYQSDDYGCERVLTVTKDGATIGQRDPFPHGVPVDHKRRQRALKRCAQEIIAEHEEQQHAGLH